MDQPNHGQTPDLATILNNLAAIAQQQQQEQQQRQAGQATAPQQQYPSPIGLPPASYGTSTHASSSAAAYENSASTAPAPFHNDFSLASHNVPGYDNSTPSVNTFNISQDSQASARLSQPMNYPQMASGPRSTTPQKTPTPKPQAAQAGKPPMIDPATILEWSQGLRCITKIAAQNPGIRVVVQKMIADQHENELMWWGGRRARMNQRVSPEELQAYDAKIHRALREMFIAMSGHLKSLGVPFFGVRPELIVKDENAEEEKQLLLAKRKITESELVKLQRKMLEYLEAMYKD
ncbi:uncharacterized protein J3D65DRAFT_599341 [Phyllosticta citribraziliensis]|uniref:Uncharacterized protein n=1 Tax=Phyllosticta citribraziliensis TaxID=989973 RepID=A0ABR1MB90_9PEZI